MIYLHLIHYSDHITRFSLHTVIEILTNGTRSSDFRNTITIVPRAPEDPERYEEFNNMVVEYSVREAGFLAPPIEILSNVTLDFDISSNGQWEDEEGDFGEEDDLDFDFNSKLYGKVRTNAIQ